MYHLHSIAMLKVFRDTKSISYIRRCTISLWRFESIIFT